MEAPATCQPFDWIRTNYRNELNMNMKTVNSTSLEYGVGVAASNKLTLKIVSAFRTALETIAWRITRENMGNYSNGREGKTMSYSVKIELSPHADSAKTVRMYSQDAAGNKQQLGYLHEHGPVAIVSVPPGCLLVLDGQSVEEAIRL